MSQPKHQRWPRGPKNGLHFAAQHGSAEETLAFLSQQSINIDEGDPEGITALMYAAVAGSSPVVRILLSRGANHSIAKDGGFCALHVSAQDGHLAVTLDLLQAGADLEAQNEGGTPLYMAAQAGHSKVVAALVETGANVDSRARQETSLCAASGKGYVDIVGQLLRANADALIGRMPREGKVLLPLDVAAYGGHSEVVRELINQRGIEGCGGASGGVVALCAAAQEGHVDTMAVLTDAGVIDSGVALTVAAGWGGEAPVKFLLQERQMTGSQTGMAEYVNFRDSGGCTAFLRSIACHDNTAGGFCNFLPRVVRLLIDAGADTVLTFPLGGQVGIQEVTPLFCANHCLHVKGALRADATEEQLHRLEAVRRLLLRVDAVHAVSWLWHIDTRTSRRVEHGTSKAKRGSPLLRLTLPMLRGRARRHGLVVAPLLRLVMM